MQKMKSLCLKFLRMRFRLRFRIHGVGVMWETCLITTQVKP